MFGITSISVAILLAGLGAGLYMAWNIGANDLANSMSSAVGAKAITHRQAVVIASVMAVLGAMLAGEHVTKTVQVGIFDTSAVTDPNVLALGAFSAVLAAGIWITIATWKSLPISTSHSIVGGMLGFGLLIGGIDIISWSTLIRIVLSWITSPIFGGIAAFLVFKFSIVKLIFNSDTPFMTAKKATPYFLGITFFIIFLSLLYETTLSVRVFGKSLGIWQATLISIIPASIVGFFGKYPILKGVEKNDGVKDVEKVFKRLQVITSCYVAFSFGANNVGNAVGPIALIIENTIGYTEMPYFLSNQILLAIGGMGLALGISTWGYKVIKTVGFRLTNLTNTRGFSVDFGAATTMLVAAMVGMPISTSHTVVGAVVGVGIARGIRGVNLGVLKRIAISWLITVPIAAITCVFIYISIVQLI